jgi:hypothetical protein
MYKRCIVNNIFLLIIDKIMLIAGVITLLQSVDFVSRSQMKVDVETANLVRTGKGAKMMLNSYDRDEWEFRNYFFQDEMGQLKYSVVTGKILDYRA